MSNILEVALEQKLEQQARELWLAENRARIEAYNQQVEKQGVFLMACERFDASIFRSSKSTCPDKGGSISS